MPLLIGLAATLIVLVYLPLRASFKLYSDLQFRKTIEKREKMTKANGGMQS